MSLDAERWVKMRDKICISKDVCHSDPLRERVIVNPRPGVRKVRVRLGTEFRCLASLEQCQCREIAPSEHKSVARVVSTERQQIGAQLVISFV